MKVTKNQYKKDKQKYFKLIADFAGVEVVFFDHWWCVADETSPTMPPAFFTEYNPEEVGEQRWELLTAYRKAAISQYGGFGYSMAGSASVSPMHLILGVLKMIKEPK